MKYKHLRLPLALALSLLASTLAHAQAGSDSVKTPAADPSPSVTDPLVRVLMAKGLLTAEEGRSVSAAATPAEQRDRLASLLRDKGLISPAEYEAVRAVTPAAAASPTAERVAATSGVLKPDGAPPAQNPSAAPTPAVIAAVAPTRLLQVDPPKREGLIPDLKLGTGARVKFYGIFKTSLIHDTSSPQGNDFPLPLLAADTGPNASPEFHIRARGLRLGANFEWLDPAPKTTITGRFEFDFEGDFTRANNRNISSIRSSQPSIRLAWVRIDRRLTEKTTGFALFGQDWVPFASSTQPNMIENTNFGGLGYGAAYTRAPQARFGLNYSAGGSRAWKFQPEFAVVVPAFGDLPANVADQEGFGERQGADSQRPGIEGRFVTQWQLDRAAGVVPAQFVVSFEHQTRRAIVTAANVPAAFRSAFPSGAEVESDSDGLTAEIQLPTRFLTVVSKYYNGSDLRFFFAGQLLSNFNDTAGLTNTASAASIDGASTVVFGLQNGVPVVAPQRPVRAQGGFIQLGLPLSRIFDADPKGRNAGWTAYLYYGYDQATARDARRFGARGSRSDLFSGNVQYRLNSFTTFAYEQGYYRTRAANRFGALPLFRGIPSYTTHNIRSEFATIFTF
ncbi:MAG TPA: hypothetical protein VJ866_24205 [Pyrinomonadaceae bacterium]|nr:hypothetical protein [Pyrinomonadaceae bacterium]